MATEVVLPCFLNAEALMALKKRKKKKKRKISPKDIKYLQLSVLAGLCSGLEQIGDGLCPLGSAALEGQVV